MESLRQDLRFALRVLAKSPGFTVAVVLSLALGIGANTAIFTLMDAVLWRMLPVKHPESLLVVGRMQDGPGQVSTVQPGFTYSQYRLIHDDNGVADLAGYATAPMNVSVDGPPEPTVQGHLVTGDYFALLGVSAAIGRVLGPDDDRVPNGHPVAMLSHGYWERRFSRDPSVIGRTIRLSAVPFTIIGVAPAEFFGVEIGSAPDLFVPLTMQPTVMPAFENLLENPIVNRTWVNAIARTKPGIGRERAAAALDALFQTHPDNRPRTGLAARTPQVKGPPPAGSLALTAATDVSVLRRQFSRPLFILLAMVGVVLLTACANTANLLLARAAARRSEFAMRLALGAARQRLLRQLLVESVLLAALGGLAGILLARWATQLLVTYMSTGRTPIVLELTPNLRILTFTAAISLATGLLFGLAPAWRATRVDLAPALKSLRSSITRRLRPGRTLAVAQLALSLLLLVGAGLFVRSLHTLIGDDAAGVRQRVITLRVEPRGSDQRNIPGTSERLDRTYRELIQRARTIPDVKLASMAQFTPTSAVAGAAVPTRWPSGEEERVPIVMVYPGYFATIGTPIVRGRDYNDGDLGERGPSACIVNESFARRMFPGQDPIGKPCMTARRRRYGSAVDNPAAPPPPPEAFPIVGVVADSRYSNPRGEVRPLIYLTFLQTGTGRGQMVLHVRASGPTAAVVQRLREQVAAVDPSMPMFDVRTLEEEIDASLVQHRLIALLSSLFGGLALLLACVGLYGLLAFTLVQRTPEMGIRLALGATRADVIGLVMREALLLVGIGLAVGVPAALATARLASSQVSGLLFGLKATDPATLAGAAALLAAVAAVAAFLPARRASRVDPMVVLRAE